MEENQLVVINDDGTEIVMEILFTFDNEEYDKKYVLYVDPNDESGQVFVSSYTEEGELFNIEDEQEWEMIEEVFQAFVLKHEEETH
ncbi:DUF1292 domain-containing protein [Erysipelothrix urinaevulpis]|uniref:DUF1292 domain-containing protein n=1 Tax=Erysipelothrix urinaevulpis TaxID=2683717 RepID=UPI00135C52ED|nr:DUF1292 domain-containing protein [Erysipelothrix urinaevulpis]